MASNWPPAAWDAINSLAELDLAHYPKHVHNREAFLAKARAERVNQHRKVIDSLLASNPSATSEQIVAACNPTPIAAPEPEWAKRRDYDRQLPACPSCDSLGLISAVDSSGVEWWAPCVKCNPRKAS